MLQHINKTSHITKFASTKQNPYMLFLFPYAEEDIKKKIFELKKSDTDAITWASSVLLRIISKNISPEQKKVRIGIIPIPSRSYFKREKIHDHMLSVAKHIKQKMVDASMHDANIHVLDCLIPLSLSQQKKLSKNDRELRKENMFTIDPIIRLLINRKNTLMCGLSMMLLPQEQHSVPLHKR